MDFKDFSQLLINKFSFSPTEDQIAAIGELSKFLISNNDIGLFILKGYAGTGKTTLMKTLVDNVKFLKYNICLLAPTGRAAKVLSNYSKKKSFTIHKKIYFSSVDKFGKFETKLKINKIKNTLFIVDEASMISDSSTSSDLFKSKSLLTDIFKYVDFKTNSKLIFLGDTAQLPPVKQTVSPALNSDLIKEFYGFKSMEFTLSNVVRQSESSGILINATTIRNNILNEMVQLGVEYCFMEVSSHAISQNRIYGLKYAAAAFTNLSHDHLDYHKTFKAYRDVKKKFFDSLSKSTFSITNADDKNGSYMIQNTKSKPFLYSLNSNSDFSLKIDAIISTLFPFLNLSTGTKFNHFKIIERGKKNSSFFAKKLVFTLQTDLSNTPI